MVVTWCGEHVSSTAETIASSLMFFASAIVGPLSRVIYLTNGQSLKLLYDGIALAVVVISLGLPGEQTFSEATWTFSLLNTAAYGIYFLGLAYLVNRPEKNTKYPIAVD